MRAIAIVVYLVVAAVTVFGVLLELDVLVEPAHKIEYAKGPGAKPAPPAPMAVSAADAGAADVAVNRAPAQPSVPVQAASAKCDVTACAAAYRSFRATDCTYESLAGVRELCTKGVVSDRAAAEAALSAHADASATQISTKCNVSACAQAYVSFNRADCTYQPLEGPRRLCTKQ